MSYKFAGAFIVYLFIMNVVAYVAFRKDSRLARQGHRHHRVPETRLLMYAALGGALGAMIAMKRYHHKTNKRIFQILVPALVALYAVIVFLVLVFAGHTMPTVTTRPGAITETYQDVATDLW